MTCKHGSRKTLDDLKSSDLSRIHGQWWKAKPRPWSYTSNRPYRGWHPPLQCIQPMQLLHPTTEVLPTRPTRHLPNLPVPNRRWQRWQLSREERRDRSSNKRHPSPIRNNTNRLGSQPGRPICGAPGRLQVQTLKGWRRKTITDAGHGTDPLWGGLATRSSSSPPVGWTRCHGQLTVVTSTTSSAPTFWQTSEGHLTQHNSMRKTSANPSSLAWSPRLRTGEVIDPPWGDTPGGYHSNLSISFNVWPLIGTDRRRTGATRPPTSNGESQLPFGQGLHSGDPTNLWRRGPHGHGLGTSPRPRQRRCATVKNPNYAQDH